MRNTEIIQLKSQSKLQKQNAKMNYFLFLMITQRILYTELVINVTLPQAQLEVTVCGLCHWLTKAKERLKETSFDKI